MSIHHIFGKAQDYFEGTLNLCNGYYVPLHLLSALNNKSSFHANFGINFHAKNKCLLRTFYKVIWPRRFCSDRRPNQCEPKAFFCWPRFSILRSSTIKNLSNPLRLHTASLKICQTLWGRAPLKIRQPCEVAHHRYFADILLARITKSFLCQANYGRNELAKGPWRALIFA